MKIHTNPIHDTLELRALQEAALTGAAEMPTAAPTSPGPHTTGCLGAAQSPSWPQPKHQDHLLQAAREITGPNPVPNNSLHLSCLTWDVRTVPTGPKTNPKPQPHHSLAL